MNKSTFLTKVALLIINCIILSIWSIIPISWFYFTISILSFFLSHHHHSILKLRITIGYLHYPAFFYSFIEVLFSIWHFCKVRQIQKPGPRPLYGRRFLRKVFSRALSSGLNVDSHQHLEQSRANPEDLQDHLKQESQNENGTTTNLNGFGNQSGGDGPASNLRKRNINIPAQRSPSFSFTPLNSVSKDGNSTSFPSSIVNGAPTSGSLFTPSLAPLTPSAAKRVVRLRANSFVPEFVERPMTKDDPRAVRFHELQSLWFRKPNSEAIITRRDMETWLAWALYGVELDEIINEKDRIEKKKATPIRDLHTGEDYFGSSPDFSPPPSPIPPTTPSFGANPPRSSRRVPSRKSSGNGNINDSLLLSPEGLSTDSEPSTFSRMQMEKNHSSRKQSSTSSEDIVVEGERDDEWETVYGDRYDFLTYCLELVEARQGFTFPTKVIHRKEIIKDGKKKVKEYEQEPIKSMRLTIDPVKVSSRPLLLYLFTNFLTYLTIWRACRNGFKKEKVGRLEYLIMRPSKESNWSFEKAQKDSKYLPIWFLHGLGIGLSQYSALVNLFLSSSLRETHPILIPLQPQISQDIFSSNWLKPIGHHEFTDCLHKVIINEGWDKCGVTILSHSFGTIRHSHVLKSLGTFVKRSCFVDPVCHQLWFAWICGNFLYFPVNHDPVKLVMRWFVGRELGTANQFRYFDWSSNILWPEDEIPNLLDPSCTRFFLAGKDAILNAPETRNYLREHGVRDLKEGGNLYMDWNAAHGELLLHGGKAMDEIMAWLEESKST